MGGGEAMCTAVTHPPGGHFWEAPTYVGKRCHCGALEVSQTVETGTWCGLSVVSWETRRVRNDDGQG